MKTIRGGFTFSVPVRITGSLILLAFIGVIWGLISGIIEHGTQFPFLEGLKHLGVSLIPLTIGSFLVFTSYGVQLDPSKNRYREYGHYFFFKVGKWKKLSDRPYLSILLKNRTYKGRVMGVAETGQYSFKVHELCLLSQDHRQKTPILSKEDREKVEAKAQEISDYLGKELVTYAPKRSDRTKQRTRKRR